MSCATEIKTNVASTRRATEATTTAKAKRNKVKKFFDELRNLPIALRLAVKTITRNKKTVCCGGGREGREETANWSRISADWIYWSWLLTPHKSWQGKKRKRDEDAPDDWQVQAVPRVSLEWSYLCTTCYRYPPPLLLLLLLLLLLAIAQCVRKKTRHSCNQWGNYSLENRSCLPAAMSRDFFPLGCLGYLHCAVFCILSK